MATASSTGLESRIRAILNRRAAVGLAVGVVREGSLESFSGHGVADIATGTPVTEDTVFRVASITKTFTAIAVMQLWEQGLVDLDAPAGEYLRAYRLLPARPGFRPATLRHLLTHTAGVPEVAHPLLLGRPLFGETVPMGRPVPTPAEFYGAGLRIGAEPGRRFVYTDHGFTTLGQIVEDVSGRPFADYLREHVFAPLGMASTDLVRTARIRAALATGYELRSRGPRAVTDYEMVTAGASSAYSTTADMARYAAALLGGGANAHGSVLEPATLELMFAPQYRADPRLPGIGLAFWRGDARGHRIVEHGGILTGFTSELFLAPDDGLGVLMFTNGARQAMLWLPSATEGLLRDLLGVAADAVRADLPQHPETWADLCGWYTVPARLTDVRARLMVGGGVQVAVRGGRLVLRCLAPVPSLLRGLPLHPDDEDDHYAFRVDLGEFGIGTARVVFSRDPAAVHLDLPPMSAIKRRGFADRRAAQGSRTR